MVVAILDKLVSVIRNWFIITDVFMGIFMAEIIECVGGSIWSKEGINECVHGVAVMIIN